MVGFRVGLILALLALAAAVESSSLPMTTGGMDVTGWGQRLSSSACEEGGGGLVGDCLAAEEEAMMASEEARRLLREARRWISYGALSRDKVPCSRRGRSYYNCGQSGQANPYQRGCTRIARCARYTGW